MPPMVEAYTRLFLEQASAPVRRREPLGLAPGGGVVDVEPEAVADVVGEGGALRGQARMPAVIEPSPPAATSARMAAIRAARGEEDAGVEGVVAARGPCRWRGSRRLPSRTRVTSSRSTSGLSRRRSTARVTPSRAGPSRSRSASRPGSNRWSAISSTNSLAEQGLGGGDREAVGARPVGIAHASRCASPRAAARPAEEGFERRGLIAGDDHELGDPGLVRALDHALDQRHAGDGRPAAWRGRSRAAGFPWPAATISAFTGADHWAAPRHGLLDEESRSSARPRRR